MGLLVLDWWNSSVAAGSSLVTAHELKQLLGELLSALQKDGNLNRTELGVLSENERRTRDEIRQEIANIRREVIAVLLTSRGNRGEGGSWMREGLAEEARRLFEGGDGGEDKGQSRRDSDRDGWLSSVAEKTGLAKGRGGQDRDRQGVWDQGYTAGLKAQLQQLYGNSASQGEADAGGGRGQVEYPSVADERYQDNAPLSSGATSDSSKQR